MKTSCFTFLEKGFIVLSLLLTACIDSPEKNSTIESYITRGDSISKATADTLKATLHKAIRGKGLPTAVAFCNENALPITQLYAKQKITVSRVAERFRNPNNQFDSLDAAQWKRYQSLKTRGDSLTSTVVETNDAFVYYQPIMLNPFCASCHGNPATIPADLLATINSLYPQDKALGFSPGDLRGMWKVAFQK